jgi:hypothetical protein
MSRIERQIIVWGEDCHSATPSRLDYASAGRVSPVVRYDQGTRAAELQSRIRELTEELLRLRSEADDLRRRHRDLEASAEVWIELYERQLARANELAARLHGPSR